MPEPSTPRTEPTATERSIVLLVAAVQFVNVLDFMMVNPLGPQFAEALSLPTSELPIVAGSYTAAASVTGILGSLYLERFDRKKALVVTLAGLALGTVLGGLAVGKATLVLARVVAGLFGGPATSLAFAIVSDAIPPARRGWAFGIVMGGFAVASVLGVPAGLALAHVGGWRTPFFGVAALIAVAAVAAMRLLPPLSSHLSGLRAGESAVAALRALLAKPIVVASLALTACTMMSSFVVIPNIPAFVQYNLGLPAEHLGLLYLLGGIASMVTTRLVGPLVDRLGAVRVSLAGSALLVLVMWAMFVSLAALPVLLLSTAFFVAMGSRGVAYNTLTSQVPEPHERARFQSVQSAVQHAASSAAAFLSAKLLSELPDHRLVHVERTAYVAIALVLLVPLFMVGVQRAIRSRAHAAA